MKYQVLAIQFSFDEINSLTNGSTTSRAVDLKLIERWFLETPKAAMLSLVDWSTQPYVTG